MNIHPADCNRNCERCPIEKRCDGVLLTDSQKEAVMFCGYFLFFVVSVLMICIICGMPK